MGSRESIIQNDNDAALREGIIQSVNDTTLNFSRGLYWFSGRASYKYKYGLAQTPGRTSYNNAVYASGRASHNDARRAPERARRSL